MTALGPCVGRSELFDSTDLSDHAEAKALCEVCPVFAACYAELQRARHAGAYACPEGTWAGQLLAGQRRQREAYKAWRAAS